jgi:hypothetical protein
VARDIRDRLQAAIREADERNLQRMEAVRETTAEAEEALEPVRQAAEEVREDMRSIPSIKFTINPDSIGISLADREFWCTYDAKSQKFLGEESAHSWYDGERYAERYEWATADACIDAMIRLCADFVRMARAIGRAAT